MARSQRKSPLPQEADTIAELEANGFEWSAERFGWEFYHLNDAALKHVKRLVSIGFLDLFASCQDNDTTDAGLANLARCQSLQSLRLGPSITDVGLKHLRGLVQLRELRLDSCESVTDAGMKYLSKLVNLECLSLQYTQSPMPASEPLAPSRI
jgi:hypothetical protein